MREYKRAAAPVMVFLMVALVWYKTGIFFETNDDKCITEILCGRMTGSPDAHTVYVSCLLSLPLSLLYRAAPMVPWYGMTLILFHLFAYTFVLESIYSRCGKVWEMAAGTALVALTLLTNLYLLGCIQYTSTGALVAAAGYFCLLVQADRKRGWACFFLLQLMACLLRVNAMLMMQPMGILAMGGALTGRWEMTIRERASVMGKVLLAPAAALLVVLAANTLAYRGSGWQEYMDFLDAEAVLFDYEGLPPYGEVREILDRYQVSEVDYYAYASYMIPDWVLPAECAAEVAAYAQESRGARDLGEWWGELWRSMLEDSHWGVNRVLAVLWVFVAALALLGKDGFLLLPAAGLLAGKLFSWGFLLYQGRFPLRVSMPLLAGEMLLLLALLIKGCQRPVSAGKGRWRLATGAVLLSALCAAGVRAGRSQYSYVRNENGGQRIFMEGLRDLGAYCAAHPENRYILDGVSTGYYRGSALEYEIYGERNYIVAGSWYSNSPGLRSYNAGYLSGGDGFYFVVPDSGAGPSHPCVAYLTQETGVPPELSERITVSHGGSYLVYYFDGALHIEESQMDE